jgi:hypothetical protein
MNPYTIQTPNLAGGIIGSYEKGLGIAGQRQAQEQQFAKEQQKQDYAQGFSQVAQTKDVDQIWDFVNKDPMQFNDHYKGIVDGMESRQLKLKQNLNAIETSFIEANDWDGLKTNLLKRKDMVNESSALPDGIREEMSSEIDMKIEAIGKNRESYKNLNRATLGLLHGAENAKKLREANKILSETESQDIENLTSEEKARADISKAKGEESRAAGMDKLDKEAKQAATQKVLADIGIDAAKMAELPSGTQKNVNTESQVYEVKSTTGGDAKDILAMMKEMDRSTGLFGKGKRYFTQLIGTGSDEDILATRLESLVNAKIMGERKPGEGPMTDSDYKAKRATAPSIDASPQEWGDYLGRLEKTSYQDASKAEIKMKFLGGNNYLGQNTNKNLVINGKKVPVGSTAVEFIRDNKSLWEYTKENEDKPPKGSRIRKWNPQTKAFE